MKVSKKLIKKVKPFYAINYNWNNHHTYKLDIMEYIIPGIVKSVEVVNPKRILVYIKDYDSFKELVRGELSYWFRSRREFEIAIGDLPWGDKERYLESLEKFSIYDQVLPNLDFIVDHLWNTLEIESFLEKRGIQE